MPLTSTRSQRLAKAKGDASRYDEKRAADDLDNWVREQKGRSGLNLNPPSLLSAGLEDRMDTLIERNNRIVEDWQKVQELYKARGISDADFKRLQDIASPKMNRLNDAMRQLKQDMIQDVERRAKHLRRKFES